MMRWRLFALYAAGVMVIMLMCVSDYVFGKRDAKKLGMRLGLCLIWPVAALSRKGRDMLFKQGVL